MMKLSCSSQSLDHLFMAGKINLFDFADYCADVLGVEYIEVEDKHFKSTDDTYVADLKAYFDKKGLKVCNIAYDCSFGYPTPEENRAQVERAKVWMPIGKALGSPNFRLFAGWIGGPDPEIHKKGPEVIKPEIAWAEMIECVQELCDYAKTLDLNIVVENHNHGGFLSYSRDVIYMFDKVQRENMSLLLDTGNYVDGLNGIKATVDLIKHHTHLKVNEVAEDGHDMLYDLPAIMDVLIDANLDCSLSIEYEGEQDEKIYIKKVTDYVRAYLAKQKE